MTTRSQEEEQLEHLGTYRFGNAVIGIIVVPISFGLWLTMKAFYAVNDGPNDFRTIGIWASVLGLIAAYLTLRATPRGTHVQTARWIRISMGYYLLVIITMAFNLV